MDLLEYLKMSLLHFNVAMIYIIHKMLVLLKNHVIYIKNGIFKCFLKEYKRLFFWKTYNYRKFKSGRRKHN